MKLINDYLRETGIKKYIFAQQLGISVGSLYLITSGERKITRQQALAMEGLTKGKLKAEELLRE